ncbi:MAG TPA: bifunctional UDP-N-acetylglucosamine diphosphorylase/glucosamine-1-phosphate N-acetyltransferase GlmU [Caulobacteraceae bacterium]|nr:bifunctional UDP-N-acetylglucosamine diphosphorylase/glucosamine-1-phosphate N-acetyltransferase GlmU [Caulobacteraceae bacterium]
MTGSAVARASVILAAGKGKRMKSPLPKVLHQVGARTMIDRAIDAAVELGCKPVIVVVSEGAVRAHVSARLGEGAVVIQEKPLGTGHAVLAARGALEGFSGDLLISFGDVPLLTASAAEPLFELRRSGAEIAVLAFEAAEPGAYGRLILGGGGVLERGVEAKDATPEELAIRVCNSGVLVAPAARLFGLLQRVGNDNAQGEYYLPDILGMAVEQALPVRIAFADEASVMGVDSQAALATAEAVFQERCRSELLAAGVTLVAPATVHLAFDTSIAPGAVIEPYVVFGPGVSVESGAVVRSFCHLEGAVVRTGARVGPFARLRPGADIGPEAHIGNFVEVKNVKVGEGAKANHLAYLGDGAVGAAANIGAGTIFCNYDGFDKYFTTVGEAAFIGSNSALVAPVTIGKGAYVGSGSVITADVEADALALGRGRQTAKRGWAAQFRERKLREKAGRS